MSRIQAGGSAPTLVLFGKTAVAEGKTPVADML